MKIRQLKQFGEWKTVDKKFSFTIYYVNEYDSPKLAGAVLIKKDNETLSSEEMFFDGKDFRIELDQYLWDNWKINLLCFLVHEDILKHLDQGGSYGEYIADADNVHKEYDFDIIYKKMKERGQR